MLSHEDTRREHEENKTGLTRFGSGLTGLAAYPVNPEKNPVNPGEFHKAPKVANTLKARERLQENQIPVVFHSFAVIPLPTVTWPVKLA